MIEHLSEQWLLNPKLTPLDIISSPHSSIHLSDVPRHLLTSCFVFQLISLLSNAFFVVDKTVRMTRVTDTYYLGMMMLLNKNMFRNASDEPGPLRSKNRPAC